MDVTINLQFLGRSVVHNIIITYMTSKIDMPKKKFNLRNQIQLKKLHSLGCNNFFIPYGAVHTHSPSGRVRLRLDTLQTTGWPSFFLLQSSISPLLLSQYLLTTQNSAKQMRF